MSDNKKQNKIFCSFFSAYLSGTALIAGLLFLAYDFSGMFYIPFALMLTLIILAGLFGSLQPEDSRFPTVAIGLFTSSIVILSIYVNLPINQTCKFLN